MRTALLRKLCLQWLQIVSSTGRHRNYSSSSNLHPASHLLRKHRCRHCQPSKAEPHAVRTRRGLKHDDYCCCRLRLWWRHCVGWRAVRGGPVSFYGCRVILGRCLTWFLSLLWGLGSFGGETARRVCVFVSFIDPFFKINYKLGPIKDYFCTMNVQTVTCLVPLPPTSLQ